jgi:hypothetical protein
MRSQKWIKLLMVRGGNMKICKSTESITGCGKEKDEKDFRGTKHGRMKVCRECMLNYRRGTVTIRRKPKPSAETELYNQFDKLIRG